MKVTVVYKEPGKDPEPREIDAVDPTDVQALVGGYFEAIRIDGPWLLLCNEDGQRLNLAPNIAGYQGQWPEVMPIYRPILGPVIIVMDDSWSGGDGSNFASMPEGGVESWTRWLTRNAHR